MSTPAHDLCLSVEEYLELEGTSAERHEYVAGRVFAMVGATDAHNVIAGNLYRYIYDPVRDAGCHIYGSDMKLRVEAAQSFYYPDLMVTCEPFEPQSIFKSAPCLVIEVLSPSTMDVDRREKLIAYRHLTSLTEYVLVYQDKKQIELYRKDAQGDWHCSVFTRSDSVIVLNALPEKSIELNMNDVYRGLNF
jgi:Uma2 family endonuclease